MSFIAFLGCDGSGKSAVIEGITLHFETIGRAVALGHWRPKAFSHETATLAVSVDDPHGKSPRGLINSVLKLGWLWLNWRAAWFGAMGRSAREGMVIFDRYHADLLVDPRRYRYGAPMWLARLATRVMPQPDRVFFLDAAPEVLLSRKQEVSHEALEANRRAYLNLASQNPRLKVIDASRPVDLVIADVLQQMELMEKGR
jgi:thymidylate kinase